MRNKYLQDMLPSLSRTALGLTCLVASTNALLDDFQLTDIEESDPRLFFANYTSSLISVNSTLLTYALAGLAIAGAGAVVLYFLATQASQSSSSGYANYQHSKSRGFREDTGGYAGILTLLSVATDIYGRLQYNDIDCQKKIICEFMDEPEIFGDGAVTVQSGVKYAASFLAPMGFPIFSSVLDATTTTDQDKKSCEKKFASCEDISLKETYKESAEKVAEIQSAVGVTPTQEEEVGCHSQTEECATPQTDYEYEYYDRK